MRAIQFTSEGWLGRPEDGFTEENLARACEGIAALWASDVPSGVVYVAYDGRPSSEDMARLAAETMAANGLRAKLCDTHCPMAALTCALDSDGDACGGIMVGAADRPAQYLGLVVRSATGTTVRELDLSAMSALMPSKPSGLAGSYESVDLVTPYIERISRAVGDTDFASDQLKVVIDPMCGSTREHGKALLSGLGLEVTEIHAGGIGGETIHPDAQEPWIDECERTVVSSGSDCGFSLEGSGSRLAVIDRRGRVVTSHQVAGLVLSHLVEQRGMSGRVVVQLSGSSIVRRQAKRLGLEVVTTPIGFSWAEDEISKGDVLMAVDSQGGLCVPSLSKGRDGLLSMLLVCELMATSHLSLDELVIDLEEKVGHMEYALRDVRLDAGVIQMLRNMLPGINPAKVAGRTPSKVSHEDGIRFGFDDGAWVLMRPSRTQSTARVYAEAATPEQRDNLLDAGIELARGGFSS